MWVALQKTLARPRPVESLPGAYFSQPHRNMSTSEFSRFLKDHLARVEPLSRKVNIAYWNASISGKREDFERCAGLQVRLQQIYADKEAFERIRRWRTDPTIKDPLFTRQIELLYYDYLRNQIDPELNEKITRLGSEIENHFNIYRGSIDGRTLTSNEILQILRESDDSVYRKKAWETGKAVGEIVADELITLVKLRNQAARSLGYDNFYSMSLDLSEQNELEILALFDELDELTRDRYEIIKRDIDRILAAQYGISPKDIRPWHYEDPFFQETPRLDSVDLDRYFESHDIIRLVREFYAGINLEIDEILEKSDLYERPGKGQHAYCMDIDRKGDTRILANVKNNENWTGTMLHELGHAVYVKNINPSLPFLLREEAHTFATEAIAMLFGRLSKNAEWIQAAVGISRSEKEQISDDLSKSLRLSQLIFARWCQVMLRFERALYSNPDQDLNALWWKLVRKYQRLKLPGKRNAPDWASKTHFVSAPVYYHNYMLGELLASQLDHYIRSNIIPQAGGKISYHGQPEIGAYLKQEIFSLGTSHRWDQLIKHATGEPLTPRYFVDQFVR